MTRVQRPRFARWVASSVALALVFSWSAGPSLPALAANSKGTGANRGAQGANAVHVPPSIQETERIQAIQKQLSVTGLGILLTLVGHPVVIGGPQGAADTTKVLEADPAWIQNRPWATSLAVLGPMARGPAVQILQERLNAMGDHLAVDGAYGPVTGAALRQFERSHHLPESYQVGVTTWRALLGIKVRSRRQSVYALAQTYGTTPLSIMAWNPDLRLPPSRWASPLTEPVWLMPGDVLPSAEVIGTGHFATPVPASSSRSRQSRTSTHHQVASSDTESSSAANGGSPSTPTARTASSSSSVGPKSHGEVPRSRFFALVLAIPPSVTTHSLDALAAYMGGSGVSATVALTPKTAINDPSAVRALSLMGADVALWVRPNDTAPELGQAVDAVTRTTGSAPVLAYAGPFPSAGQVLSASRAHLGVLVVSRVLSGLSAPGSVPTPGSVVAVQTTPDQAIARLGRFLQEAKQKGTVPGPALSLLSTAP